MGTATVDACVDYSPSNHFGGDRYTTFTSDDVLAAYIKGKNRISDEVHAVLSRTIPMATKHAPEVVNLICEASGISVSCFYIKIIGLSGYEVLCAVSGDDYVSSAKMRKAYVTASEIEEVLYDNSFKFSFRFIMQSESLNESNIFSEGYRRFVKK